MFFGKSDAEIMAKFADGSFPSGFIRKLQEETRESLSWQHIVDNDSTYPQYDAAVDYITNLMLGYLPPLYITIGLRAGFKTHIFEYRSGKITQAEFMRWCRWYVKYFRKIDMQPHSYPGYPKYVYQQYNSHLLHNAARVQDRLKRVLGYTPKRKHSVVAELHLRNAYASDQYCFPEDRITTIDIQAAKVIKYREILLEHSLDAANKSDLIAEELISKFK